jgi:hypothetical protein
MSKLPQILGYAAGYVLVVFIVGGIVVTLLSLGLMWLVPLATMGAVNLTWPAAIATLTLAVLAKILIFK